MTKKFTAATKYTNRKVDEIYREHLLRDKFIGDDENCKAVTLIDYLLNIIPKMDQRDQMNED